MDRSSADCTEGRDEVDDGDVEGRHQLGDADQGQGERAQRGSVRRVVGRAATRVSVGSGSWLESRGRAFHRPVTAEIARDGTGLRARIRCHGVAVLSALRVTEPVSTGPPRGQRSRDLLAALLLRRGQPVDPGVLLDLVWGDGGRLTPAVVHTQVARLRRDIGGKQVVRPRSATG